MKFRYQDLLNEINFHKRKVKKDSFYPIFKVFGVEVLNEQNRNETLLQHTNEALQMWFRVEVEHRLFAGFTLFDTKAKKEGYSIGHEVEKIEDRWKKEAEKFLDKNCINPEGWWFTYVYPNGKKKIIDGEEIPDFKTMNACAVSLIDEIEQKKFVKQAVAAFEEKLLKMLV